jgi:flagellar protein FliS
MTTHLSPDGSTAHAANVYAQTNIENAPPVKIVRLLYQGAVRFIDRAAACGPREPGSKFTYWLGRAEDVVVELRLSIEHEPAPQIAESLTDLYLFVEAQLQASRRDFDPSPLTGARAVLVKLLEAWSAIDTGKP